MPTKLDELFYDIGFQVDEAGVKQAQQRAQEFNRTVTRGQEGLERFGATGASALRQVGEEAGLTSGQMLQVTESINRIVQSLRSDLAEGIARARLELEEGIIDEDEFRDTARAAVEAFERELSDLERRLERTGQLPPEARRRIVTEFRGTGDDAVDAFIQEFAKDADRAEEVLREAGRRGGQKFGREIEEESKVSLSNIEKFLRGGFIAGIVTALAFAGRRIIRFFEDVATKIRDTLRKAGEIEGVERAFGALSTEAGLDATRLLEELRQGARSTASDLDLMRSAAEALQTGLRGTEEQFGELVRIGRRMAKTIGVDANEAFERLVRGVVRGRRRILDDISILVDFNQAHADFAAQLGVSVDALDETEKAQARLNAVVEKGQEVLEALGPDVLTTGEKVDQLATFFTNVKNEAIAAFATSPRVRDALDSWAEGAENAADAMRELRVNIAAVVDTIVESFTTFEGFARILQLGIPTAAFQSARELRELFEEFQVSRQREFEIEDIGFIGSLEELSQKRQQVASEIQALQDELNQGLVDEAEFLERLNHLREQSIAIRQRETRLKLDRDEDEDGLTEEKIQARIDAVGDLITQMETLASVGLGALQFEQLTEEQQDLVGQLIQIRSEIEKLEAVMETGRGTQAMAERLRFLRDEAAGLEEEIGETIDLFDDLDETIAKIAEGFGAFEEKDFGEEGFGGRAATEKLASRLRRVQAELERFAEAEGDPIEQSVELKRLLNDLQLEFTQLSGPIQRAILRIIGYEQAVKAGIIEPTEDADDAVGELSDTFGEIADGARGVLQLADAIGVLDDDLRRTLQGAIELADGIQAIREAAAAGEGIATGNFLQVAGGAIGLASGIAGALGLFGESQETIKAREDLARESNELARALAQLRREVDNLRSVFSDVSTSLIEAVQEFFAGVDVEQFIDLSEGGTTGRIRGTALIAQLQAAGIPVDDFIKLLESMGEFEGIIALLEGRFVEAANAGETSVAEIAEELRKLPEFLAELEIERLFETFSGRLDLLRREFELFDIEKPIDQLRRMRDLFLEFADLPPELEAAIRGADLTSPEGRAQFEQAIQRLFRGVTSGEITTDIPLDQFLDQLGTLEGLLDQLAEEGVEGEGAESFQIFRGVTETTAQRLEGLGSTRNLILHNIDRNVAAIAADMGVGTGPAGGFLEPGGFPTGDGGGGTVEAEMIPGGPILLPSTVLEPPPQPPTTQQILLDIAVHADIDLTGVDSPEEVAEIVAQLLGDRVTEEVNDRLGRRLVQLLRADHGVGMERRV